jgi:hypothetical protein
VTAFIVASVLVCAADIAAQVWEARHPRSLADQLAELTPDIPEDADWRTQIVADDFRIPPYMRKRGQR